MASSTTVPQHHVNVLPAEACHACATMTPWRCMECQRPTCPACQFSMHALCQSCRERYTGPIYELGARADRYIRAEFERLFR